MSRRYSTSVHRLVYAPNGKLLSDATWFSNYVALPEILLVGPKPKPKPKPKVEAEAEAHDYDAGDPRAPGHCNSGREPVRDSRRPERLGVDGCVGRPAGRRSPRRRARSRTRTGSARRARPGSACGRAAGRRRRPVRGSARATRARTTRCPSRAAAGSRRRTARGTRRAPPRTRRSSSSCARRPARRSRRSAPGSRRRSRSPPSPELSQTVERELGVVGEARHADADEAERARAGRAAPGRAAQHASSPMRSAVVGARAERGRARPDREVGIAELGRDRPRGLAALAQVAREPAGHPAQLVVEPLDVADVALERLLARDRDALGRDLERPRVDAARAVAHEQPDLAREHSPKLVVLERGEPADRLDPGRGEPLGGTRADSRAAPAIGNGARNAASRPGRTTVSPPGLRRSDATFATTFDVATPSEHESRVLARTTALTASASARASSKAGASSRRGRGSPRRCPPARRSARSRARSTRPRASARGTANRAGARRRRAGQRRSASAHDIADTIPNRRAT